MEYFHWKMVKSMSHLVRSQEFHFHGVRVLVVKRYFLLGRRVDFYRIQVADILSLIMTFISRVFSLVADFISLIVYLWNIDGIQGIYRSLLGRSPKILVNFMISIVVFILFLSKNMISLW